MIITIPVSASLEFKQTTLTVTPKPFERKITASYVFTNNGNKVVSIHKVETGCGCTAAELDKRKFGPGESGEIKVNYKTKGKSDRQKITVLTSDRKRHELTLNIKMKPLLNIKPKTLFWKKGEQPETRVMKVSVGYKEEEVKVVGVESQSRDFAVELKEVEESWEIHVTPKDTSRKRIGKFEIKTDYPEEKPMSIKAYGRVK